jgi:hypothetical protein
VNCFKFAAHDRECRSLATHVQFVAMSAARHYFESSDGPKEIRFYYSDHALNADARRDRIDFL